MIMVAEFLIATFVLIAAVSAVVLIVCCSSRPHPPVRAASPMPPSWPARPYGQTWNSWGVAQPVHVLPGTEPVWPGMWVAPAHPPAPRVGAVAVNPASVGQPGPLRQRRRLSGQGRRVIVHGGRR